MKSTVRKGNITETKVILKLLELGFNIYTPYGDGSKVDIIAEKDFKLIRIQCKSSYKSQTNKDIFNAYSTGRTRSSANPGVRIKYSKEQIDYFASVDSKDNVYLIPIDEVSIFNPILENFKKYILYCG